jgi:hypothetical protein
VNIDHQLKRARWNVLAHLGRNGCQNKTQLLDVVDRDAFPSLLGLLISERLVSVHHTGLVLHYTLTDRGEKLINTN